MSEVPLLLILGLLFASIAAPVRAEDGVTAGKIEMRACSGPRTLDHLRAVSERGDLTLGSGATARLVGIRLPGEGPLHLAALSFLRARIDAPVQVEAAAEPDRWGRIPVRLGAGEPSENRDFAVELVERGLALVDPAATEAFCGPDLLAPESRARQLGLGVWADDRYKAVAATQTERLRERIGRFAVVEGRIRSVGERRQRTYLNFGTDWASDFTVVVPKRVWAALLQRSLPGGLASRTIRVRGILEDWQGPALTVTVPEAVELIGDERRQH